MKYKFYLPYELSIKIWQRGFEFDFESYDYSPSAKYVEGYPEHGLRPVYTDEESEGGYIYAPTYDQAIDWLSTKGWYISRIWYDDGVTPPRWTYDVCNGYNKRRYSNNLDDAIDIALTSLEDVIKPIKEIDYYIQQRNH